MCGIAGYLGAQLDAATGKDRLDAMGAALRHRGPDDSGIFLDQDADLGLVHRRLAIIDLSPTGRQPMTSKDGRYVIVFNGEMYNFEMLRAELLELGASFAGSSDTEVLLHGIVEWGLEKTLTRAVGMFAFALWDRRERTLYLARDRLGEKPLYLVRLKRGIAFASELTAIRASRLGDLTLDPSSLALYLKYAYVPAPHAIYRGTEKVMPGAVLAVTTDGRTAAMNGSWQPRGEHGHYRLFEHRYWSPEVATPADVRDGSPADGQSQLDALLEQAVRLQLRADVPVGAFLSGGIDSSLICAVAQSLSSRPLKTFTMGFGDPLFDESRYAAAVAKALGTDHTRVPVSAEDALELVPRMARIYDEPFADPSQLPTYLVSEIARREVTVCLTGDGGDELFGGYNRYIEPVRLHRRFAAVPRPAVNGLAALLQAIPAAAVDRTMAILATLTGIRALRTQSPGRKLHKLGSVLKARDPREIYEQLMSHWREPATVLAVDALDRTLFDDVDWSWADYIERAMLWDVEHYLPDNNLAKVDRASMAVSLETRLPLLDHRVVELALGAPVDWNIRSGIGKRMLRTSLARFLPRSLIDRPKMGFSVPIAAWLRGPLLEWVEDHISESAIRRVGLFEPKAVRECWEQHRTGRSDNYLQVWLIIVAHAWIQSADDPVG